MGGLRIIHMCSLCFADIYSKQRAFREVWMGGAPLIGDEGATGWAASLMQAQLPEPMAEPGKGARTIKLRVLPLRPWQRKVLEDSEVMQRLHLNPADTGCAGTAEVEQVEEPQPGGWSGWEELPAVTPAQDASEAAADESDLEEGQLDEDAEAEFAPEGV